MRHAGVRTSQTGDEDMSKSEKVGRDHGLQPSWAPFLQKASGHRHGVGSPTRTCSRN